jgi:2-dehydropantoate 2-reductase
VDPAPVSPRFVVLGAGAIGGVLGAQLARAGLDVVLVDPLREHVDAINRDGLRLKGVHGSHVVRVPAVPAVAAAGLRRGDVVVCAVKSYHTDAAMQALRRATPLEPPVFCAQNGVRNEEVAGRSFADVHGVMVLIGAKRLAPGEVVHTSAGPIGVGRWPRGLTDVDREVAEAIGKTDIPSYTTEEIAVHKWNKLALNLNNATFGLIGLSGQEARADAEVRAWMADVCEEGVRVLRAAGIAFEGPPGLGSVEARIRELRGPAPEVVVPADEELRHRPSLWQDLYHRGGQVEADWFNGEIVRLGRAHGVPTPCNRLLLDLITEAAARREPPGRHTIRDLRARLGR